MKKKQDRIIELATFLIEGGEMSVDDIVKKYRFHPDDASMIVRMVRDELKRRSLL